MDGEGSIPFTSAPLPVKDARAAGTVMAGSHNP